MIARAIQRNVHISAKKATLCCRLIRNKTVDQALRILENQPQKASKYLIKLLFSAIANAINNHSMSGRKLYVFRSVANQGRTLKRGLPRAKGRSDVIKKRFSHLEVVVSDDPKEGEKMNKFFSRPKAHRGKTKHLLEEKQSVEILPKIIAKKQKESQEKI